MRRVVAVLGSLVGAVALLGALLVAAGPPATADPAATGPDFHDVGGIHVVSAVQDGERLWRLLLTSTALQQQVHLNVVLPVGYTDDATARFPVLYLYHGTGGSAEDWIDSGDAVASSAPYPMILVIPDAGYDNNGGGWFTDWVDQHTGLGTANWETYGVDQLVPFVDATLRTRADRNGRAVAGLSQGGYGAFAFAARHPDTFVSAGSFSGAPDISSGIAAGVGAALVVSAVAIGYDNVQPDAFFGNRVLDAINWDGHNPADLLTNLRWTDLNLWTGNGLPGRLDPNPVIAVFGGPVEILTEISTKSFTAKASRTGIPYRLDAYGRGTHTFPYWTQDLVDYLPRAAALFANPPAVPTTVGYRSVEKTWTQWGWSAANLRAVPQAWSALDAASATGFTYTGGPATVTTPPLYRPGSVHTVRLGRLPGTAVADDAGRLTVTVPAPTTTTVRIS